MEYNQRNYRKTCYSEDLIHFLVSIKDTDLDIAISKESYSDDIINYARSLINDIRCELEAYIYVDPVFRTTLVPHRTLTEAPSIAVEMAQASELVGVGPMAAVAGAISEFIGRKLLKYSPEIIVENGGDLFIKSCKTRNIGIFAGESPFTNKIAIEIKPELGSVGLCTSSGTVGPSLSFGKADAAIILAKTAAIADAAATAMGNIVKLPEDVQKGVEFASGIAGVLGAVVIMGNKLAVWGEVKLSPIIL